MGKPDQIDAIEVISGILKIVPALRIGTGREFHKAGPDIEKALYQVLVFISYSILFEFVERIYFELFGRTSKSSSCTGWLSFRARKVIVNILK